jgi:uncharacterized membrane protein YtjA (UPF0391 family)
MLQMAVVFLVIGLIAAVLGFGGLAGASFAIAKFLAGLFLVLFLVFLVLGRPRPERSSTRQKPTLKGSAYCQPHVATMEGLVLKILH